MGCLRLNYDYPEKLVQWKVKSGKKVVQVWLSVDPLAHRSPHQSPFVYCGNNPMSRIDPDGMEFMDFMDFGGGLGFGSRSEAKQYRKEHNTGGRIQKNSDGSYSINNHKTGFSYRKYDGPVDPDVSIIGLGKDGVLKAPLITGKREGKNPAGDVFQAGMALALVATADPIPGDEAIIAAATVIAAGATWLGYEIYQYSAHKQNQTKKNWDTHSGKRSGGDPEKGRYGQNRNNNRGNSNKKHVPYPNPNKRLDP